MHCSRSVSVYTYHILFLPYQCYGSIIHAIRTRNNSQWTTYSLFKKASQHQIHNHTLVSNTSNESTAFLFAKKRNYETHLTSTIAVSSSPYTQYILHVGTIRMLIIQGKCQNNMNIISNCHKCVVLRFIKNIHNTQ